MINLWFMEFQFSWTLILVCLSNKACWDCDWIFAIYEIHVIYMLYGMLILSETFVDIARNGHMLIAFEQRTRPWFDVRWILTAIRCTGFKKRVHQLKWTAMYDSLLTTTDVRRVSRSCPCQTTEHSNSYSLISSTSRESHAGPKTTSWKHIESTTCLHHVLKGFIGHGLCHAISCSIALLSYLFSWFP